MCKCKLSLAPQRIENENNTVHMSIYATCLLHLSVYSTKMYAQLIDHYTHHHTAVLCVLLVLGGWNAGPGSHGEGGAGMEAAAVVGVVVGWPWSSACRAERERGGGALIRDEKQYNIPLVSVCASSSVNCLS